MYTHQDPSEYRSSVYPKAKHIFTHLNKYQRKNVGQLICKDYSAIYGHGSYSTHYQVTTCPCPNTIKRRYMHIPYMSIKAANICTGECAPIKTTFPGKQC